MVNDDKMFGGRDNSGNNIGQHIMKDTLHVSPHIATHKSSSQSNIEDASSCDVNSRLTSIHTLGHVAGYRVGIPTSTIFADSLQNSNSIKNQATHIQVPTIFTLPQSKSLPQDLSSHNKLTIHESENASIQRNLSHIHSVGNQNVENFATPLLVPVSDRTPTYYRLVDGTTLSISSHHQLLVPSQNDDNTSTSQNHQNSARHSHHEENSMGTSGGAIPLSVTENSSHQHTSVGGLQEGHVYLLPHEISNGSGAFLAPDYILPDKEMKTPIVEAVKEEDEHKDLVRQALQAAVHNSHKSNTTPDAITYNYGTEDMRGSDDCLVHDDIICHSTFCSQPNIKAQELFLMNINVNQGQQSGGKLNGSVIGSNLHDGSNGGQVVVLDSTSSMDEAGHIMPPIILTSRRRRSRLTEEAQAVRREKIANRMREKRASETEDQKVKRRLREAERMRKKRAMEDETSKEKRRREAAERARLRRAKLSNEEREMERKKAAARMRLRRQNENDEQKRLRRIKAAERMRKRRSKETPEERAARKLAIALRMKVKRQKKEDTETSEPNCLDSMSNLSEGEERDEIDEDQKDSPETIEHHHISASHLLVNSASLNEGPENLTILQSDHHHHHQNESAHVLPQPILSAVQLVHISSPAMSHQLKLDKSHHTQKSSNNFSEKASVDESVVSEDDETAELKSESVTTKGSDTPPHQTKSLHINSVHIHHHHHHTLPHLHHHLSHQDQTPPHTSYIVPHLTPHAHSQNQPVQMGHQ